MSASGRRRAAFDPGGLDDLHDVLAPPPALPPLPAIGSAASLEELGDPVREGEEEEDRAGAGLDRSVPGSPDRQIERPASSRSRSTSAGRVSTPSVGRQSRSPRGRVPTAVRLPADLYRDVNEVLLVGSERPSYGQLVMWTVEDHLDDVVAEVEVALPVPSDRSPRGRRLAQDRVAVGLQLLASERAELDELAVRVAAARDTRVTRTDVATAALRVAVRVRRGPSRR